MSPPPWLHSSLQDSNLAFAIRTLDTREFYREAARGVSAYSPPPSHAQIPLPFHPASNTSLLKDYFSCSVGQHPANRRANRYLALEPYNRTRVLVPNPDRNGLFEKSGNSSESRYINANWIREAAGGKWWIAGQAPLPNTMHAFLTLGICPVTPRTPSKSSYPFCPVQRVHTIVQLTPMVEGGRRRAHSYFPGALCQDMILTAEPGCDAAPIFVRVAKEEKIEGAQCIKTDLLLRWGSAQGSDADEWSVTHLLYTAWPDFGVPEDNHSILEFARLVERENNRHLDQPSDDLNTSPPVLVHCSAGVGRTGSFLALCSLLRAHRLLSSHAISLPLVPPLPMSPLGPLPDTLSGDLVAREIDCLREQRTSMVQKEEQVVWVYEALRDAFDGM